MPQDTAALIKLQGGNQKFIDRLNFIFDQVSFHFVPLSQSLHTFRTELLRLHGRTVTADPLHVPLRQSPSSEYPEVAAGHRRVLQYLHQRPSRKRWLVHGIVSHAEPPTDDLVYADSGAMGSYVAFYLAGLYPLPATSQFLLGSPYFPEISFTNPVLGTTTTIKSNGFRGNPADGTGGNVFVKVCSVLSVILQCG